MRTNQGFTLIEVIITIVILAVAAAAMTAFFSQYFRGSTIPAGQVQSQYRLIQQMELFTSQYRYEMQNNSAFDLSTFKSTYIDGKTYVDGSKTDMRTFTYGAKTSTQYLRVTLTDGAQTLMTIFTY